MKKKILIITASARKTGNTVTVAKWVADGAREGGAEVEIVDATRVENKNNGCIGCRGCQKSDEYRCMVKDETAQLVARMLEQDVVVLATPVYFGSFSAQLKRLIDRMYCLIKTREGAYSVAPELASVSMAFIATAGGDHDYGLGTASTHMKGIAAGLGKRVKQLLIPDAPPEPGELAKDAETQKKSIAFGRELAGQ
ncbi:MAG: flavodoxin family protein [Dehalococcoidia bacterium]